MRDRAPDPRDAEERLLGGLDALGDRGWHLFGLAVTDSDHAVAVAHHDQCREAEPPATLNDLGDAVDRDHALEVRGALLRPRPAAVVASLAPLAAGTGAAPRCC